MHITRPKSPKTRSLPELPQIVSLPPPPSRRSLPRSPSRVSLTPLSGSPVTTTSSRRSSRRPVAAGPCTHEGQGRLVEQPGATARPRLCTISAEVTEDDVAVVVVVGRPARCGAEALADEDVVAGDERVGVGRRHGQHRSPTGTTELDCARQQVDVDAVVADDDVLAALAEHEVVPGTARDDVAGLAAHKGVVATAAVHRHADGRQGARRQVGEQVDRVEEVVAGVRERLATRTGSSRPGCPAGPESVTPPARHRSGPTGPPHTRCRPARCRRRRRASRTDRHHR